MEKELPIGWIETDFDSIITRVSNGANLDQKDVYFKDSYPISRIETIAQETIDLDRVKYVEVNEDIIDKYCLKHGDILFSHINSDKHLGKTAYFDINTPVIHGINLLLIRCNDLYNSKLLHYLFKYYRLEGKFIEVAQRAVNQSSINQKRLKEFPIPLPSFQEQQRIVAKLDTLFRHLDALKTRLDRIPQLLKDFRQKVLTQAVTGKLTEEWREGRELKEWKKLFFEEVILSSGNGISKRRGDAGKPITVVRLADFKNAERIYGQERTIALTEKEVEKYLLQRGDILVIRVNGSVNIAGLFILYAEINKTETYCDHFIRLKIDKKRALPDYITYLANSGEGRNYLQNSLLTSAGQNTINQKSIYSLKINLPSVEEQQEIVRRVESLFAKADRIEAGYQKLKAKIEQLPQALLAKAFHGELVGQLPTDGDARDLLKLIKQAKAGLEKGGRTKKMKENDEVRMVAEEGARYGKK